MSPSWYMYTLSRKDYEGLRRSFPELLNRRSEFKRIQRPFLAYRDPPGVGRRRKEMIKPSKRKVQVLAKSGRGDWDFALWLNANKLYHPPPPELWFH